jgi:hypothetical protein
MLMTERPLHQLGREHAQTALKRQAEADLWRKHVEVKAIQLQAKLLEQRSILTWGPVALEVLRDISCGSRGCGIF